MTRSSLPKVPLLLVLCLAMFAELAHAQYFGRNKVRHESFDFEVMHTPHFDIYYYPKEEEAARDVGRMAERWYARLSVVLDHHFNQRKPIVLYADDTDFQQTNVIAGQLGQGTGGVTESFKNRVVMPLTGSYADTDHVLGHEIVHVFQYDLAQRARTARLQLGRLPLWFIEGMAEYLSVGPTSSHTAMWLRDAVLHDELPDDKDLASDPRYFPYRFGHAMWSYVAGRFGDRRVIELYDACMHMGLDLGFEKVLGMKPAALVAEWNPILKGFYAGQIEGRQKPADLGRLVLGEERGGRMNLAPTLSPDGTLLAFLSEKSLFSVELFLADARTGKILHKLTRTASDGHIDALRFIDSAGSWSPDGSQFAFVVFVEGDNEIAILDVTSREVVRRIRVEDVGSLSNPAWSPDGRRLAFSGLTGTASDLFVLELQTEELVRLTDDAYADMRPAWSPDGKTLAFVTDRGAGDIPRLAWGTMGIGLVDPETGVIEDVLRPFDGVDASDPAFGPSGFDLFFRADRGGFSNIYRLDLTDRRLYQVTDVATGVTGITELSPAITVAMRTGDLMFTIFRQSNYEIHALAPEQTAGTLVEDTGPVADGSLLPPLERDDDAQVASYLADITTGLPDADLFRYSKYRPSLGLDYVGQTGVGVFVDRYGVGAVGGIFAGFSDMLGNHNLGLAIETVGGFKDTGAQVLYSNQKRRYNWGVSAAHIPFLSVRTFATPRDDIIVGGEQYSGVQYDVELERVFLEQLSLLYQYPLSRTRRIEFDATGSYYSFDTEVETYLTVGNTIVGETTQDVDDRAGFGLLDLGMAYVGDTSFYGFVSPIRGTRYRFAVSPVTGSLDYYTLLADYRRYLFKNPTTFAARVMHYGRYGKDAEDDRLFPLYLGYSTWVRGYDLDARDIDECDGVDCPVYDNLQGSRMALASIEWRTQVLGTESHGLVTFPFVPLQLSAFVDTGMAWSSDDPVQITFDRNPARRVPVVSTGFSARIPLFGALPLEFYYAKPLQRPDKDWVFGFLLAPGW